MPLGLPHSEFLSWDEDDQDKALGFTREQAKQCSGCGTRKEDWDADRFAFVADSYQCPGCELISMEQDNVREGLRGVKIFLRPNVREG